MSSCSRGECTPHHPLSRVEQGPLWSLRRLLFGRWVPGAGGPAPLRLNSPVSSLVPSEALLIAGPGGAQHCASVRGLMWSQGLPRPRQTPELFGTPALLLFGGMPWRVPPRLTHALALWPPVLSHGAMSQSQNHNLVEVGWHVADLLTRSRGCTSHVFIRVGTADGEKPSWHVLAPLATLLSLPTCAQDPGSTEERALCGRAEHPPEAAADLQPPWAGGTPAPGVLLHCRAAAVPLRLACPEGARQRLLEGTERVPEGFPLSSVPGASGHQCPLTCVLCSALPDAGQHQGTFVMGLALDPEPALEWTRGASPRCEGCFEGFPPWLLAREHSRVCEGERDLELQDPWGVFIGVIWGWGPRSFY